MKTSADKTQKNKSRAVANTVSRKQSSGGTFQLVDNRPETVQLQKLQEIIANSPHAKKIAQFQAMMDNSKNPHHVQLQKMQEMIANSQLGKTAVLPGVLQKKGPLDEEELQLKSKEAVQKKGPLDEEELQFKKDEAVQCKGPLDEEELQFKKDEPVQRKGPLDEEELQFKAEEPVQKQENRTGLPDDLKAGVENLSGMAMDDVRVHYNSGKPAQLNAYAYTQGTEIHVAPGQEKHLPHEAWHVVQQKQGRVQPTVQMKGIAVNDNPTFEQEADQMGRRAVLYQGTSMPITNKKGGGLVLQGNFPDAANDERRESQGIAKEKVQLDHMVPQASLKTLVDTLKTLHQVSSDPNSKWVFLKEAMNKVSEKAGPSKGDHDLLSEGHLINIQKNIVPGLANQIQGAKNRFDPQMESGANGVIKESEFSLQMRKLDDAILQLNGFVFADFLPIKASDSKNNKFHNSDVEQHLVDLLNIVSDQLNSLNAQEVPSYTSEHWYQHGDDEKWVKKRSAVWLDTPDANAIGQDDVPEVDDWEYKFLFEVKSLGINCDRRPVLLEVPVNVTVKVPSVTWTHIFKRHYLPTFAWDIQAVNTFWKEKPSVYLMEDGKAVLTAELTALLKKHFNFSKPIENVEFDNEENASWSEAEQKLFFQAQVISIPCEGDQGLIYEVEVDLKSIAPQNQDLAFAITPSKLQALKPIE